MMHWHEFVEAYGVRYPVRYTMKQDGTVVYKDTTLEGWEMTENQIIEYVTGTNPGKR